LQDIRALEQELIEAKVKLADTLGEIQLWRPVYCARLWLMCDVVAGRNLELQKSYREAEGHLVEVGGDTGLPS
jgi:hypothetical protein